MIKKALPKISDWQVLRDRIIQFADAQVANSWAGGGDPADMPILKVELELARLRLDAQLEKMEREYE